MRVLAFLLAVTFAAGAGAATPGDRLVLDRHCGGDDMTISIMADGSLSHEVAVDGDNGGISSENGAVKVMGACRDSGTLVIRVPPAFPVTIDAAGSGQTRIGALQGHVIASLRGDGGLEAERLGGGLVLENNGSGDVNVGALSGASILTIYGSGDLSIGSIDADTLAITGAGSGDVSIGRGRIGKLKATSASSGDFNLAATVDGGEVVSTGSGDISVARVLGALVQVRTGSGDISVGQRGPARTPTGPREAHAAFDSDQASSDFAVAIKGLFALVLLGAVLAIAVMIRRRRRSVGPSRDPRVASAADRLDALARRVARVEALVTSRDFELNRRFREMG